MFKLSRTWQELENANVGAYGRGFAQATGFAGGPNGTSDVVTSLTMFASDGTTVSAGTNNGFYSGLTRQYSFDIPSNATIVGFGGSYGYYFDSLYFGYCVWVKVRWHTLQGSLDRTGWRFDTQLNILLRKAHEKEWIICCVLNVCIVARPLNSTSPSLRCASTLLSLLAVPIAFKTLSNRLCNKLALCDKCAVYHRNSR